MRPPNIAGLKRVALGLMSHTYTRSVVTAGGSEDDWGDETQDAGTALSGLPCLYSAQDQTVVDAQGTHTVSKPTLHVPPTDTLAVGDIVTAVLDRNGAVLLAGPLVVDTINPYAGAGQSVMKVATLNESVGRGS